MRFVTSAHDFAGELYGSCREGDFEEVYLWPNRRFAPDVARLVSTPATLAAITPENVPR